MTFQSCDAIAYQHWCHVTLMELSMASFCSLGQEIETRFSMTFYSCDAIGTSTSIP